MIATAIESKFPQLPPKLWMLVLPYLQKPKPKPLSRPPRSELRQSSLCRASLVCQVFHSICQPLLYTHIWTDDICYLMYDIREPARQKRFHHTKSLALEHGSKEPGAIYVDLMREGAYRWDLMEGDKKKTIVWNCGVEVYNTTASFCYLLQVGVKKVFPRLTSIAACSIHGMEPDCWSAAEQWSRENEEQPLRTIGNCRQVFQQFLEHSSVQHLCIRDPMGLYTILTNYIEAATPKYTLTIHFEKSIPRLHFAFGALLRLVSDVKLDYNWRDLLRRIGENVEEQRELREEEDEIPRGADVDIYCSTRNDSPPSLPLDSDIFDLASHLDESAGHSPNMTVDQQRHHTDRLGPILQDYLRESGRTKDLVRFHPSADTPICLACGSGSPEGDEYGGIGRLREQRTDMSMANASE